MIAKYQLIEMAEDRLKSGAIGRERIGLRKILANANKIMDSGEAEFFIKNETDFNGLTELAEDVSYWNIKSK